MWDLQCSDFHFSVVLPFRPQEKLQCDGGLLNLRSLDRGASGFQGSEAYVVGIACKYPRPNHASNLHGARTVEEEHELLNGVGRPRGGGRQES